MTACVHVIESQFEFVSFFVFLPFFFQSWLAVGNSIRATAATGMNDKSSRSHSVFTIIMTQTRVKLTNLFVFRL